MSTHNHSAQIIKIAQDSITIEICRQEACAGCAIKSSCQIHRNSQQQLSIPLKDTSIYSIGEQITIELTSQTGFLAIFYAYVLPLILMLSTLLLVLYLTNNELTAGIFSIFILIPYYIVLLLCQKCLNQKFSFKISKK